MRSAGLRRDHRFLRLRAARARIVADDRDDLIVGAPGKGPGADPVDPGAIYVYRGTDAPDLQPFKWHSQND